MKCNQCGKEADSGSLIPGFGFSCSEKCSDALQAKRTAYHEELRLEGIGKMPEKLETHDFERWALKFAVCWLHDMPDDARRQLGNTNPIFLVPEHLADEFKQRMLPHIHRAYVSDMELRGHNRMFNDGVYCFRQPVPAEKIIEAARKAELLAA